MSIEKRIKIEIISVLMAILLIACMFPAAYSMFQEYKPEHAVLSGCDTLPVTADDIVQNRTNLIVENNTATADYAINVMHAISFSVASDCFLDNISVNLNRKTFDGDLQIHLLNSTYDFVNSRNKPAQSSNLVAEYTLTQDGWANIDIPDMFLNNSNTQNNTWFIAIQDITTNSGWYYTNDSDLTDSYTYYYNSDFIYKNDSDLHLKVGLAYDYVVLNLGNFAGDDYTKALITYRLVNYSNTFNHYLEFNFTSTQSMIANHTYAYTFVSAEYKYQVNFYCSVSNLTSCYANIYVTFIYYAVDSTLNAFYALIPLFILISIAIFFVIEYLEKRD